MQHKSGTNLSWSIPPPIWREDYKDRPVELISPLKGRMLVVFGEKFKEKLESEAYNRIYSNEQVTAYLYIQMLKQK